MAKEADGKLETNLHMKVGHRPSRGWQANRAKMSNSVLI